MRTNSPMLYSGSTGAAPALTALNIGDYGLGITIPTAGSAPLRRSSSSVLLGSNFNSKYPQRDPDPLEIESDLIAIDAPASNATGLHDEYGDIGLNIVPIESYPHNIPITIALDGPKWPAPLVPHQAIQMTQDAALHNIYGVAIGPPDWTTKVPPSAPSPNLNVTSSPHDKRSEFLAPSSLQNVLATDDLYRRPNNQSYGVADPQDVLRAVRNREPHKIINLDRTLAAAKANRKREAKFRCGVCGSFQTSKQKLDNHIMSRHLQLKGFGCPVPGCNAKYGHARGVKRHLDSKHPGRRLKNFRPEKTTPTGGSVPLGRSLSSVLLGSNFNSQFPQSDLDPLELEGDLTVIDAPAFNATSLDDEYAGIGIKIVSELSQVKQRLSDLLQDQVKRKALLELRGVHAQSWIDCLNDFVSDPEIRGSAEPWLLKHTVIILRKLCEVSTLYPTCYVLGDIHDTTLKCGGGFGDIYQGYFKGQPLCLKVVRIYQDSNITRLLRAHAREAILWGQLDHPNIVPFYGIFYMERKERICLVAPWMRNGDIVEYLQRTPDAPRKPLIDDIANGLHYLHSKNIVHGDLKGRNVLIDDHQRACLADFGLSTILTNETLGFARTTTTTSGHTTRWASPELLEEYARPTRESDVWAFGCLCYEVLTGLEPFAGCSDISVIAKLMRRQLPAALDNIRLHSNEIVDKKLRDLIGRCWLIETERRPQYAEILQQLEVENLLQQSKGHSLKNPDQFWLRPPGNPDIFSRFRDLLEQLYHGDRVDRNM